MRKTISHMLHCVADLLIPRFCIVCGERLLLNEKLLCLGCLSDMPKTYFWTLEHNEMADRFNSLLQEKLELRSPFQFEKYTYAVSLLYYKDGGPFCHIPHEIKYQRNLSAGRYFGNMLGTKIAQSSFLNDVDTVIPVPLHWKRQWKRGYNQAEVIAIPIAECLGATVRTDILYRTRQTKTQTKLSIEEKATNVSGAFAVKEGITANQENIRHILLVDDVFTTGSTMMACYEALRSIFPPSVRISVATLEFVGGA